MTLQSWLKLWDSIRENECFDSFYFLAYKAPLPTVQFSGTLAEWSSQLWMAARFHAPLPPQRLWLPFSSVTQTDGDCNSIFQPRTHKHLHQVGVMSQKVYRNSFISGKGLWYPGNSSVEAYGQNIVHSYLPDNVTTMYGTVRLLSGCRKHCSRILPLLTCCMNVKIQGCVHKGSPRGCSNTTWALLPSFVQMAQKTWGSRHRNLHSICAAEMAVSTISKCLCCSFHPQSAGVRE